MGLKIFKFGGASVSTTERILGMSRILKLHKEDNLVVVISAMGKTTNELEKVLASFYKKDKKQAEALFNTIKMKHRDIMKSLIPNPSDECISRFDDICMEIHNLMNEEDLQRSYDFYYDQIVGIGELLSTSIISSYLNEVLNIKNVWVDVRDILKTDNNYRDVNILWNESQSNATKILKPLLQHNNIVIIQGFIGSTVENETTTLGREGSDYTAAIFANILHAESQTIWKDVEGVMNADPKIFPNAEIIDELNYNEVIEMAYYGAQIIHPKTLKPLHNKSIPLNVKCFLDPKLKGTIIHNKINKALPPIIMKKDNQTLLSLTSKDLSFISEQPVKKFYDTLSFINYRANLIHIEAITLFAVLDHNGDRIGKMMELLNQYFNITMEDNKQLITIRHYKDDVVNELIFNKNIILKQQTKHTYQVLVD